MLKQQLLKRVTEVVTHQQRRNGTSDAVIHRMLLHVDGSDPEVLVMGFARRFATYKRAVMLFAEPELLPGDWRRRSENRDETGRARVVADYIAGMTDRYALDLHRKLFDPEALQTA